MQLLKQKGIKLFKEGKYNEARYYFTIGSSIDPSNHCLHLDISLTFLKLEEFDRAIDSA